MVDYKTISVNVEDQYTHYYFIKKHYSKEESQKEQAERTLFVANLPYQISEELLKKLFSQCGKVESGKRFVEIFI